MKYISYILVLLTTFSLSSCFTGIESTPKINSNDVIKRKAEDTATPETELAKQMTALPLPEWTAGREYVVTNDRISLVFNSTPKNMLPATGDTICYAGYKKLPSIAATENTLLLFTKKGIVVKEPLNKLYFLEYSKIREAELQEEYNDAGYLTDSKLIIHFKDGTDRIVFDYYIRKYYFVDYINEVVRSQLWL